MRRLQSGSTSRSRRATTSSTGRPCTGIGSSNRAARSDGRAGGRDSARSPARVLAKYSATSFVNVSPTSAPASFELREHALLRGSAGFDRRVAHAASFQPLQWSYSGGAGTLERRAVPSDGACDARPFYTSRYGFLISRHDVDRPRHLPVPLAGRQAAARRSMAEDEPVLPACVAPADGHRRRAHHARAQRSHRGRGRRRARHERRRARELRDRHLAREEGREEGPPDEQGRHAGRRRRARDDGGRAAQQQLRGERRQPLPRRSGRVRAAIRRGPTVYFAGDTAVFGDMRLIADLYAPQIACLPIGDLFTMGPEQAAFACDMLRVKQVLPVHWGTFPALTGNSRRVAGSRRLEGRAGARPEARRDGGMTEEGSPTASLPPRVRVSARAEVLQHISA